MMLTLSKSMLSSGSKAFTHTHTLHRTQALASTTTIADNILRQLTTQKAPSGYSNKQRPGATPLFSSLPSHLRPASIWDADTKNPLQRLFDGNERYRAEKLAKDPDYFSNMATGQSPQYLLIGCSDSRVEAQGLMGCDQGELFIHRNIANVFVPTDLNLLSVIFFSVNVLKVKDIIVLGHYQCGGVRAASENKDLGLIEHWLSNIRDVQRLHQEELNGIEDHEERHRRLVELNVQEQCFNLFRCNIVQQMQAKTGRPRIHGLVYDIADGKLINLNIDFKKIVAKYRDIYTVADFRHYTPVNIDTILPDSAKTGNEEELGDVDRLVALKRSDLDPSHPSYESLAPRPLQCRGTTTILQVKLAVEQMTGLPVANQGLYKMQIVATGGKSEQNEGKVDRMGQVIPGLPGKIGEVGEVKRVLLEDDNATLDEVGVRDICEVELREEIVPAGFRR